MNNATLVLTQMRLQLVSEMLAELARFAGKLLEYEEEHPVRVVQDEILETFCSLALPDDIDSLLAIAEDGFRKAEALQA